MAIAALRADAAVTWCRWKRSVRGCCIYLSAAREQGLKLYHAGSHEQYSYSYYPNYLPDHMQRIEEAVRCLTEEGNCKAAFYNQGFFGNTAWE